MHMNYNSMCSQGQVSPQITDKIFEMTQCRVELQNATYNLAGKTAGTIRQGGIASHTARLPLARPAEMHDALLGNALGDVDTDTNAGNAHVSRVWFYECSTLAAQAAQGEGEKKRKNTCIGNTISQVSKAKFLHHTEAYPKSSLRHSSHTQNKKMV